MCKCCGSFQNNLQISKHPKANPRPAGEGRVRWQAMSGAFTLAEVLITLGIIGIVAAMTLPTLITNTQDKQFRAAYKKSISEISQAMKIIYSETEETYTSLNWIQMPVYFCKLQRNLKVAKSGIDCGAVNDDTVYTSSAQWPRKYSEGTALWHEQEKWYDKQNNPQLLNSGYWPLTMDLMDGIRINFNCYDYIFVDVNGDRKPNTIGRDIYFMYFTDGATSPDTGFSKKRAVIPNACSMNSINSTPTLTKDNYVEDCLRGSGWGCSFML